MLPDDARWCQMNIDRISNSLSQQLSKSANLQVAMTHPWGAGWGWCGAKRFYYWWGPWGWVGLYTGCTWGCFTDWGNSGEFIVNRISLHGKHIDSALILLPGIIHWWYHFLVETSQRTWQIQHDSALSFRTCRLSLPRLAGNWRGWSHQE